MYRGCITTLASFSDSTETNGFDQGKLSDDVFFIEKWEETIPIPYPIYICMRVGGHIIFALTN